MPGLSLHALPWPRRAVRSKAVILLLSLHVGVCVGSLFCSVVLGVFSSLAIILLREGEHVALL